MYLLLATYSLKTRAATLVAQLDAAWHQSHLGMPGDVTITITGFFFFEFLNYVTAIFLENVVCGFINWRITAVGFRAG